jgi:predicted  nucleic acid-binding Zn-ribbon protein
MLGTFLTAAGPEPRLPKATTPKANPDAQAILNRKVEALEVTVAELRAQLKAQAAQIQKVSAQLEVSNVAVQVVSYGQ